MVQSSCASWRRREHVEEEVFDVPGGMCSLVAAQCAEPVVEHRQQQLLGSRVHRSVLSVVVAHADLSGWTIRRRLVASHGLRSSPSSRESLDASEPRRPGAVTMDRGVCALVAPAAGQDHDDDLAPRLPRRIEPIDVSPCGGLVADEVATPLTPVGVVDTKPKLGTLRADLHRAVTTTHNRLITHAQSIPPAGLGYAQTPYF